MKIKNIIAPNMTEALAQIKAELGEDAVIISSENAADGSVMVTAALEDDFDISFDEQDEANIVEAQNVFDERCLRECLEYHAVVQNVGEKVMALARQISREQNLSDNKKILEKVFDKLYRYDDILDLNQPVKLFMGTPGSGKSTAIAKAATQAKFKKIPTCIISTDNVRAGANKQLEAFAKILELDFYFCKDERGLFQQVNEAKKRYALILIDTPGINPFIPSEVDRVGKFAEVIKNQAILTMDTGRNTFEAVEIAEIFAEIGASCLLPTRLDLTRRIGAVLSVAACCGLSFCAGSVSSSIANGLAPIDSKSLAKLVLTEA